MSEPVSNAEIEDVLSSIRRLVSENAGALRRERGGGEEERKLVLTPAFRIDERDPDEGVSTDEAGATQDETSGSEVRQPALERATTALEKRIAELEAAVAGSPAEFEPDGSELPDIPDEIVFAHAAPEPAGEEDEAAPAPEQPAAGAAAPAPEEPSAEAAQAPEEGARDEAPEAAPEAAPEPAPEPGEDEAQDWEDLGPEIAEEAAAEDEFVDEIEEEPFGGDEPDEEEAVIDEAMLREMVGRMVRDELQGSVGERITHNVRRMVRREIARALALQDFE